MTDPFSVNLTDEAGSGDGSGTDEGEAGGLLCPICGKMMRTVPPESEETDARVEEDQYCNCEEFFASFGMELLTIRDPTTAAATGSSTTFSPTVQVINFPMDEGTSGVNITEIPLADEPDTKNAGLSEKLILDSLVPEDYNHPSSEEVDDEECSICMEKHKIGDVLGRIKCTHKFHFNCIKKWLLEKNFCPNCKEIAIELKPQPPK